ncbi:MAG: PIG-L family deacetylase [Acidimicrobiales bacterium]
MNRPDPFRTLVCFHAHPDDEAISTGGLMAKAAAAGHRVIVVTATNGEMGEPTPGVLDEGENLADRRLRELARSAEILGAQPPRLLGYRDSGMMGEPSNDDPACFWRADVDAAAARLAEQLADVDVDVLIIYDDHGLYGHPDHIQVHRVGLAAAPLLGVEQVYEATVDRDAITEATEAMGDQLAEAGIELPAGGRPGPEFGTARDDLSYQVDVSAYTALKRKALATHQSQVASDSMFLSIPEDLFAAMFGLESYAVPGRTGTGGPRLVDLLPGLDRSRPARGVRRVRARRTGAPRRRPRR